MNIRFAVLLFLVFSSKLFSQQSYYNDVNLNLTGLTLKEELAVKIINTHTRTLFYDQIWTASKATDVNPNNPTQQILQVGIQEMNGKVMWQEWLCTCICVMEIDVYQPMLDLEIT